MIPKKASPREENAAISHLKDALLALRREIGAERIGSMQEDAYTAIALTDISFALNEIAEDIRYEGLKTVKGGGAIAVAARKCIASAEKVELEVKNAATKFRYFGKK